VEAKRLRLGSEGAETTEWRVREFGRKEAGVGFSIVPGEAVEARKLGRGGNAAGVGL
jgi:hypothetical protein